MTASLGRLTLGVLGAVDEAEQVALVEGAEAVDLVDDTGGAVEAVHQSRRELEAEVEPVGADVEEQIAGGRGRGVLAAGEARERVQVARSRRAVAEQAIPQRRADAGDADELALGDPEPDRALERADVGQQLAHDLLAAGRDRQHQEDRRLGQRRQDPLARRLCRCPRSRALAARA